MYTATVSLTANATSIRNLVNTAVPGEIPSNAAVTGATFGGPPPNSGFDGRCILIEIIVPATANGTVVISSQTPGSAPPANNGVTLQQNTIFTISAVTGNQISIDEVLLSGTATTVGIIIFVA